VRKDFGVAKSNIADTVVPLLIDPLVLGNGGLKREVVFNQEDNIMKINFQTIWKGS